jgi:hypothetical protein
VAIVNPNIPAMEILSRFRGRISSSKPGYPEVLLLTITDADGGKWEFCTFDADFSPSDPDVFLDKVIVDSEVAASKTLTISFSDGSTLTVIPRPLEPGEAKDELENWYMLTPDNRTLDFGPEGRWRLGRGDEPW